ALAGAHASAGNSRWRWRLPILSTRTTWGAGMARALLSSLVSSSCLERQSSGERGLVMLRRAQGFTLIELMVVVAVIGVLAAIAIPNFIALQVRAREGSTKANMHTLQVGAEDYAVQNNSFYADDVSSIVPLLPGGNSRFQNPFDASVGSGNAWLDHGWPIA